MSQEESEPRSVSTERAEALEKTERRIRGVGYIVLFGAAIAIFVPMVLGAIEGVQKNRVWDPFTGSPVMEELDCVDEAGDLIYLAGEHSEVSGRWEQRYNRWVTRCRDDHQELHDLLRLTRKRMRGTEEPPEMGDVDKNESDGRR